MYTKYIPQGPNFDHFRSPTTRFPDTSLKFVQIGSIANVLNEIRLLLNI